MNILSIPDEPFGATVSWGLLETSDEQTSEFLQKHVQMIEDALYERSKKGQLPVQLDEKGFPTVNNVKIEGMYCPLDFVEEMRAHPLQSCLATMLRDCLKAIGKEDDPQNRSHPANVTILRAVADALNLNHTEHGNGD